MNNELTIRQRDALNAIVKLGKKGYPPTHDEIAVEIGLASTFAVRKLLDQLTRKKFISRNTKIARAIKILKEK